MAGSRDGSTRPIGDGIAPVRYRGRTVWLVWRPERVGGRATRPWYLDAAQALLRELLLDDVNGAAVRRVLREATPGAASTAATEDADLDHAARLMESGRLALVEPAAEAEAETSGHTSPLDAAAEEEEAPAPAAKPKSKTFIKIQVVLDASGKPVAGVRLRVTLPDGVENFYSTNGSGEIDIQNIDRGSCDVKGDIKGALLPDTFHVVKVAKDAAPADSSSKETVVGGGSVRFLARVDAHKVKSGESIKSLAEGAGLKWQELAKFNWGTDVPEKINEHLRDEVGCTKKTKDGYNYMFHESDNPGIMYIPRVWSAEGLATGETHVIRVRAVERGVAVRFVLKSETTGHLLPGHPFSVYDSAGRLVAQGKTDEEGEGAASVPKAGEYEVVPGPDAAYSVSGRVHRLKSQEPLGDAEIEVRPWQAKAAKIKTGPRGEIALANIPHGELVLAYKGAEYSVFVDGDIADAFFFVPYHEPGESPEAGEEEQNI